MDRKTLQLEVNKITDEIGKGIILVSIEYNAIPEKLYAIDLIYEGMKIELGRYNIEGTENNPEMILDFIKKEYLNVLNILSTLSTK